MRRRTLATGLVLVATAAVSVPAVAFAHRAPTRTERRGIVRAFDRATHLHVRSRCLAIVISTPLTSWGEVYWRFVHGRPIRGCGRDAGNGVSIVHHRAGRWRFVYSGDNIARGHCRAPGVPTRVLRDFGLCR